MRPVPLSSKTPEAQASRPSGSLSRAPVSADNVIDLSRYRAKVSRRARSRGINRKPDEFDNYAARMLANALVFLFSTALIITGVWLMNGLAATHSHFGHLS